MSVKQSWALGSGQTLERTEGEGKNVAKNATLHKHAKASPDPMLIQKYIKVTQNFLRCHLLHTLLF